MNHTSSGPQTESAFPKPGITWKCGGAWSPAYMHILQFVSRTISGIVRPP